VETLRLAQKGADAEAMRGQFPTWSENELRLRAEWLATCDERAVVEAYEAFHTGPFMELLPRVSLPALLMVAGRGEVIAPKDLDEVRRNAPAIDIKVVAGAGHMIPWDDFVGFTSSLEAWLPELHGAREQ
jgi:N-formylmaleamate deformylase